MTSTQTFEPQYVSSAAAGEARRPALTTSVLVFIEFYDDGMNKATKKALTIALIVGLVVALPLIAVIAQTLMATR